MTRPLDRRLMLAALAASAIAGCTPRARALPGSAVTAVRLPDARLPQERQRIVFRWEYSDPSIVGRGEGVARVASPDSVRLDFFLDGGVGGGYAILVGDSVSTPPGGEAARRFLPPPPLLWASLGRLAVPAVADTSASVDGSVLRADIGRDPLWRVTFRGDRLARLERISGGRIEEWVSRGEQGEVRYENERARRSLVLKITRTDRVSEFDASIWRR